MDSRSFTSKTFSPADLAAPGIAPVAGALQRFALRLGLAGVPFAVNGVLRRRLRVRRHKLWEYACGIACLLEAARSASGTPRALDFGGGATLPVFYLARVGWEMLSLDVDASLAAATNRVAEDKRWRLRASTHDLTQAPPPEAWGQFDAVISFSVLEHLSKPQQPLALERLAALVKPGGVLVLTFDFGADAPVADAVRDAAEVERLVAATRLAYLDGRPFADTGERFALDKRYPGRRFTFGSVFLCKPAGKKACSADG